MENHHVSCDNSLFLWPFSIAMLVITKGYIIGSSLECFSSLYHCINLHLYGIFQPVMFPEGLSHKIPWNQHFPTVFPWVFLCVKYQRLTPFYHHITTWIPTPAAQPHHWGWPNAPLKVTSPLIDKVLAAFKWQKKMGWTDRFTCFFPGFTGICSFLFRIYRDLCI